MTKTNTDRKKIKKKPQLIESKISNSMTGWMFKIFISSDSNVAFRIYQVKYRIELPRPENQLNTHARHTGTRDNCYLKYIYIYIYMHVKYRIVFSGLSSSVKTWKFGCKNEIGPIDMCGKNNQKNKR